MGGVSVRLSPASAAIAAAAVHAGVAGGASADVDRRAGEI